MMDMLCLLIKIHVTKALGTKPMSVEVSNNNRNKCRIELMKRKPRVEEQEQHIHYIASYVKQELIFILTSKFLQ